MTSTARKFVGLSIEELIARVEKQFDCRLAEDFADTLRHRTIEAFRQGLEPIPGIVEALVAGHFRFGFESKKIPAASTTIERRAQGFFARGPGDHD